ncbi:hypothetical protein GGR50DRAFT_682737 [Xylaria sp. CBS 124048]|nr:hypothetical protein GGR50DRAFT_682737 [Xylaria sp. CBS 124048]
MATSSRDNADTLTASQMTAGKADLLLGTWIYPCRHRFSWILDYHLPRRGKRAPGVHKCPRCSENPTCLVCLGPFDPKAECCAGCETFFDQSLLRQRREKLIDMNVRVMDERASVLMLARLEAQRKRFVDKWGGRFHIEDF